MNNVRAPKLILTPDKEEWELFHVDKTSPDRYSLSYRPIAGQHGMVLIPQMLEREFLRVGRPEPGQKIVSQGRWECGPAALSMLLKESLWDVKRAMVASGWNNDDSGCSDENLIAAAKLLGYDLHPTLEPNGNACLLTVPSLNYKNKSHALCFNGIEMLDPNWGFKGRLWYGTEWGLETVCRYKRVITFKQFGCPEVPPRKKKVNLKKIKEQVLKQLLAKPTEDLIEDLFPAQD
jgi:hypothetical protein